MRLSTETTVASLFLVISISYLIFAVAAPPTFMIGDTYNYDPGGRFFPLGSAVVMLLSSVFLLVKSVGKDGKKKTDDDQLFSPVVLGNILLSVGFILVFRHLGFILSSGLFICNLIILNFREIGHQITWRKIVWWNGTVLAGLLVLYSIARGVIKICFWLARTYNIQEFREPVIQAAAVALVTGALFAGSVFFIRRANLERQGTLVALVSIGTVFAIFVLFRLVFLVQLPGGIIKW